MEDYIGDRSLRTGARFRPEAYCYILDAIDDAIIETDALIAKQESVRLGLLDDLIAMPAQIANPSAPDTLAGLVGSISSGCSVNADDRPPTAGEYGVLKTSAVGGGRFRPQESKAVWPREINRLRIGISHNMVYNGQIRVHTDERR